jgi:hypothetical protein
MVVSLDKLGILPESTNCKEVQELVSGENSISNPEKMKYEKLKDKNFGLDENENMFCLISGVTTGTHSFGLSTDLLAKYAIFLIDRGIIISEIMQELFGRETFLDWLYWGTVNIRVIFWISLIIPTLLFPLRIGGFLTIGSYWDFDPRMDPEYYPANGWVHTIGLNGLKTWDGSIYGNMGKILTISGGLYKGIVGFTGLKIIGMDFFLGSALRVKLGYNHP